MALAEAGLMTMAKSAETDPAVIARVVDLIVGGPALSQSDQLSANGVNGKRLALGEEHELEGERKPAGPEVHRRMQP